MKANVPASVGSLRRYQLVTLQQSIQLVNLVWLFCQDAAFLGYKVSNFIVTFQEKGGKKWEYDEFFFQNQENAGESGSIAALRELSQKDKFATVLQYYSFILKGIYNENNNKTQD